MHFLRMGIKYIIEPEMPLRLSQYLQRDLKYIAKTFQNLFICDIQLQK